MVIEIVIASVSLFQIIKKRISKKLTNYGEGRMKDIYFAFTSSINPTQGAMIFESRF